MSWPYSRQSLRCTRDRIHSVWLGCRRSSAKKPHSVPWSLHGLPSQAAAREGVQLQPGHQASGLGGRQSRNSQKLRIGAEHWGYGPEYERIEKVLGERCADSRMLPWLGRRCWHACSPLMRLAQR